MTTDSTDQRSQLESLDALRREVAQLTDRLSAIETAGASTPLAMSPSKPPAPVTGVSEELIGVISAAIAAYLGVLPHIRQISLVGGDSWAQQGRVTIQASHTFEIRHD
jgi:methylmalonyl-CoA carboxyltransferase large subunit